MNKLERYKKIVNQIRELVSGEPDPIANAANVAAVLYHELPDVNWVGFYFHRDGQLVLGPFQGRPACTRIPLGKGVCGTAAQRQAAVVVDNVHEFPGHIACDTASNSEIVVPLMSKDGLLGVLDIDSPELKRFDAKDQAGLQSVIAVLLERF